MIRLLGIDPAKVYVSAGLYEDLLRPLCARHPSDFSYRDVQDRVCRGEWQMWIAWDEEAGTVALACTALTQGQDGRITAEGKFLTGRGIRRWLHLIEEFQEWARKNGATHFKAPLSPGYERLLAGKGYRKTHVILEKGL